MRLLDEEQQADDSLREQFKEKWTRTPSAKLTEMFRSNASKYQQIMSNATDADRTVRDKFEKNRTGIEMLSKSLAELQSSVPTNSNAGLKECPAVSKLRELMEAVSTILETKGVLFTLILGSP